MPKNPEQPPIWLWQKGEGDFRTVQGINVQAPPEGCESMQLMDWCGVCYIIVGSHKDMPMKLRVVQAYAERYDIPITDQPPANIIINPDGSITVEQE